MLFLTASTFLFVFSASRSGWGLEGDVIHASAPSPSAPLQEKNYSQSGVSMDSRVSHFSHLLSGSPAAGITLPPTGLCPATESHSTKAAENLAALIICPIFPRAEGWWLLYITYPISSSLLRFPVSSRQLCLELRADVAVDLNHGLAERSVIET